MSWFSTADGFMAVNENLEMMIKYIANEPSVGLYFIQQHSQSAMPNLLTLKNRVVGRTRETTLHIEDLEDCIESVKSMTEFGVPVIDGMISDINRSMHLMSISAAQSGLSRKSQVGSNSQPSLTSSNSTGSGPSDGQGYLKSILSSAKKRASSFKWSTSDTTSQNLGLEGLHLAYQPMIPTKQALNSSAEELPVSDVTSSIGPEGQGVDPVTSFTDDIPLNYDTFQSEQEARLEEWLQEAEDHNSHSNTKRPL